MQVANFETMVSGLETERDFYFGKLRDIENACQENADNPLVAPLLEIMYATQVLVNDIQVCVFSCTSMSHVESSVKSFICMRILYACFREPISFHLGKRCVVVVSYTHSCPLLCPLLPGLQDGFENPEDEVVVPEDVGAAEVYEPEVYEPEVYDEEQQAVGDEYSYEEDEQDEY